jgi:lipopolysaccharide export system protein LptC
VTHAVGLEANMKTGTVTLLSQVRSLYEPKRQP